MKTKDMIPKNDWNEKLKPLLEKDYSNQLFETVDDLYKTTNVVPEKQNIFKAFELTSYKDTKVVILGQDPYPKKEHAIGLSFSIPKNEEMSKSLINIYKELDNDLHIKSQKTGDLTPWAKQGVLLLNTILTNTEGKRRAHDKIGWQVFTNEIFNLLNKKETPIVFILWGNDAIKYKNKIAKHHFIIESSHPSPLGAYRGFWGSKPFSKTNNYLKQTNQTPIKWA